MSRVLAFAVAVACSSVAHAQPTARDLSLKPSDSAEIRGRVTDVSGRPLGFVEIRASAANGEPASGLTDADGQYRLTGLPGGMYIVTAVKPNYLRSAWGEQRTGGAGARITLAGGETAANIDFCLARGGAITGTVIDESGDPLVNVRVSTMRNQFVQGTRRLMPSGGTAATNDLGEYRIYGLPPGQGVGVLARGRRNPDH